MAAWISDLRHGARMLVRNTGSSMMAVLTLGLAIGATTAIFSVVYGVLLRPLPYPNPDRLTAIWEVNHRGGLSRLADPNFDDFHDRNGTFAAMARYTSTVQSIAGPDEPTRTLVTAVSRDFFTVFGVQAAKGRTFSPDDARIGAAPTAVVSDRYWKRSLGASLSSGASLSERTLRFENREYAIVGVMPAGFEFPASADIWVPAELDPEHTSRTSHNFYGVGRLKDGATVEQAGADLSRIAKDIIRQSPDQQGDYLLQDATALSLQASLTRRVGSTLYILLGAVGFLLVIGCANVTNLLLAQAAARRRELAIRHALGAGRGRLARQFLAESLVLLTPSCAIGLLLAWLGLRALLALAPPDLPNQDRVSMDAAVLTFAMAVSATVAIGLGLVTAVRAGRRDSREALTDGARGQTSASGQRIGRVIVVVQMALTVVLLVGAGLLGRSLLRALAVNPGFRTQGIVAIDLNMPYSEDPAAQARLIPFYTQVFDRLRTIGGTTDVAATTSIPLTGGMPDGLFLKLSPSEAPKKMDDVRSFFQQKDKLGTADYCAVTPEYFRVLDIPLVRGRVMDDHDRADGQHVAVINEALARSEWPGVDPLGKTIEFGNMDGDLRLLTIVGIVGDTHDSGLEQAPRPTVYVDLMQRPHFSTTVVMRSTSDASATIPAARAILKQLAPEVPPRIRTFDQIYAASLGSREFNLSLVAVFAVTALILAVAGVYGVLAHGVAQRRREIGVRMALGASRGNVLRKILGQGLATIGAGVLVGILAAIALSRTIESLLFGVTPTDPLAFAAVITLLVLTAGAACYVPARRAMNSNPLDALREG